LIDQIPVKVGLQQRVLPSYRVPFFDALAEVCLRGFGVFAGDPRKDEALDVGAVPLKARYYHAHNLHALKKLFYVCWQVNILNWLNAWEPEVLIMEANSRYPASYSAIRWMRRRGGKLIGWGLGSPTPAGRFSNFRLNRRRKFLQKFDALITYSQAGAREYASLGFPAERIFCAPNAVAPKPTQPLMQRPLEFAKGKPVVLFVGRLQARKKLDRLIKACAQLPADLQPVLQIVGDGPQRHELEALAEKLYPAAKFFGAQHGNELDQLFQNADLFVLPGTGGLAVQQAMSFGLPVIVGEADGTQSELVRPENGWMLRLDDPAYLADVLQQALSDVKKLRKMGAASYRIVSEEVNLEKMVEAFVAAVNSVLEG
jgi:glycosyltransferase involved in cell wall biosynthesis